MAKLTYAPLAQDDIKNLSAYIARDKPNAARKWVQKVRQKCRLIAKNPGIGDSREDLGTGVRCTYLGDYNIYFRVRASSVEVMRVMRGGRDFRFL
jgi:toxin ParE1/3/4